MTLSVRSRHVPDAPGRWPGRPAPFHTDFAGHGGDLIAKVASVSIMSLIVSASSAISPRDSHIELLLRMRGQPRSRPWRCRELIGEVRGHHVTLSVRSSRCRQRL